MNAMHDPVLRARQREAMARPEVRAKMVERRKLDMAVGSPVREKIAHKLGWLSAQDTLNILSVLQNTQKPYTHIATIFDVPYTKISNLAFKHGIRRIRRRGSLTATSWQPPRFYVGHEIAWEIGTGGNESTSALITVPTQTENELFHALSRVHPAVKRMVLDVISGSELKQAARDAGIPLDTLARLLPPLRQFLTPYVRP